MWYDYNKNSALIRLQSGLKSSKLSEESKQYKFNELSTILSGRNEKWFWDAINKNPRIFCINSKYNGNLFDDLSIRKIKDIKIAYRFWLESEEKYTYDSNVHNRLYSKFLNTNEY